jgi:hypothetical protein
MLPFQKTLQELINALPQGAVFLCHAEENARQRKLLERVEETFKQQGHAVMNLSMEQVYTNTPKFLFIALLTASEEMDIRSVPAKNRLKAACL